MWKRVLCSLLAALPFAAARAGDDVDKYADRLVRARAAYVELIETPDRQIPRALLRDARCVAVIPDVYKGALIWGGRHGRGVVSCRNDAGDWSPPSFLNISGGSWGLQIGVEKTDLVLFVMNERGAESLIESEFKLGGHASVAAGPVGRHAEGSTDGKLSAEIYSYAKAKGLFAGISLSGARLNAADKAIRRYYGEELDPKKILLDHEVPVLPREAQAFRDVLP